MKLTNNRCAVEVTLDDNFDLKSPDHREYDFVLNVDGYTAQDYYRVLSLSVNLFHDKYKIALVGSGQSYPDDCAVLDDEVLTVIQDNRVVRLDLHNRTVVATYDTDLYGCAFGLYSTPDGYFIHGELEVITPNPHSFYACGFAAVRCVPDGETPQWYAVHRQVHAPACPLHETADPSINALV